MVCCNVFEYVMFWICFEYVMFFDFSFWICYVMAPPAGRLRRRPREPGDYGFSQNGLWGAIQCICLFLLHLNCGEFGFSYIDENDLGCAF